MSGGKEVKTQVRQEEKVEGRKVETEGMRKRPSKTTIYHTSVSTMENKVF